MQSQSHLSVKSRIFMHFYGPELISKFCCSLTTPNCIWKRIIAVNAKFGGRHLQSHVGVLVLTTSWITCRSVKAPLLLRSIHRFWRNICFHPDVFFNCATAFFRKKQRYLWVLFEEMVVYYSSKHDPVPAFREEVEGSKSEFVYICPPKKEKRKKTIKLVNSDI